MNGLNSSETVLSVERALVILKRMAAHSDEVGVRDLSRELGYSPAVTQKILNTLKSHDFVKKSEVSEKYSLGFGAMRVGLAVIDRLDVSQIAKEIMQAITEKTGETTFLAIRDDLSAVYISKVVSPNAVRMDAEVGSIRPLNCTAVGKVLLAWGPLNILDKLQENDALVEATSNSIVDVDLLEKQIDDVKRNGYAVDMREFHKDGICVAAPICDQRGNVIASITISGLASRMEDRVEEFGELIKKEAETISNKLGHKKT